MTAMPNIQLPPRARVDLAIHISRFPTSKPNGPALGDPEDTTWSAFCSLIEGPRREGEKDGPSFISARFHPEPDGRVHRKAAKLVARTAIVMDCEYNKDTGKFPPDLAVVAARIRQTGWAAVIYTSHNHLPRAPRYRIVLLLSEEIDYELPAVETVAEELQLSGVLDRSKVGAASLFYLPSCPPGQHNQHEVKVIDGDPISADWLRETAGKLLANRQAEQARIEAEARAEAERRRQERIAAGFDPDDSLIEKIRGYLDLEQILLNHNYDRRGRDFRHPNSQSGSFGANIKTFSGIERVYSHNAGDPLHRGNLPSWCTVAAVDAVDATIILDYGGDRKKALHELAKRFGLDKRQERKALSSLMFSLIRQQVSQEEFDSAALAEGTRLGLTLTEVISAAQHVVDQTGGRTMDGMPNIDAAKAKTRGKISFSDFYAYMPMHNYIHAPSRAHWPGASIDSRLPPVKLTDANGQPVLDETGKQVIVSPTAWLDKHKPVEQMTWAPGQPMIIHDQLILDGGWIEHVGAAVFNLYRPPVLLPGDPAQAGPWLDHLRYIYPDDADHTLDWLAHRVQRPQEKVNHALVLGGSQGIGKDTILEPVKYAIGPWNFQEASPKQVLGRFNGFLKAVILRVSEARDLGEYDRFSFYDHMKAYTAAPPDTLRVDEKNLREYSIVNVCGIIITTNHKNDGIYLSADDRRHYVAWSDRQKEDEVFQGNYWNRLWGYYAKGGVGHVAAYLRERDISGFDPKAPPPKTAAWWAIVDSNRPAEEAELADAIDKLGNPDALTLQGIINATSDTSFAEWLGDRKNRRIIPYRLEKCGYVPVRNTPAADGLWKILDKRQAVYAKATLPLSEQLKVAERLVRWARR